ncbi:MAG: aquaporin [Bacteroidetes bacterium]|nr:MAG: aquaporin [Bacteroidota bacterium]REK03533.1 MAG: aquaporin [Bacteroidota bacterium]REK34836.1 MAG: aquaporin [Bacteroidota bacterium]REK51207.1 MAG: aquaporin [Bacteroidota bacterium]
MKALIAEFTGTFFLLLIGTGSILLEQNYPGSIGNFGIAFSFGFVIFLAIRYLAAYSGAHFNPAVSIGFYLTGKLSGKKLLLYILFQLTGAFAGTLLLAKTVNEKGSLGATFPSGSHSESILNEIVLTFILMAVIFIFSSGKKQLKKYAAAAIGSTVGLCAYFGGEISGASMNPARSMSPGIVSGNFHGMYIYIIAPITGAIISGLAWKRFRLFFKD